MTAIHLTSDLAKTVEQGSHHHHLHLIKVSKNQFNSVVFEFKPFTGTEDEPERPSAVWDDDLPKAARDLLRDEYDAAHELWSDAKYVHTLKTVVAETNATAKWATYAKARAAMDAAFTALDTTPDTQWNAAVSRLVAAQNTAREAADTWDRAAQQIATVHYDHGYSLNWDTAYKRAGIDATDWMVGDHHDYTSTYRTSLMPLSQNVQEAVAEQRAHVRTVASLTGNDRA